MFRDQKQETVLMGGVLTTLVELVVLRLEICVIHLISQDTPCHLGLDQELVDHLMIEMVETVLPGIMVLM